MLCVYIYIYIHVYIYIYICIHMHTYVMSGIRGTNPHSWEGVCGSSLGMRIYYVYVYVCVYIYLCVYMYMYMYMYICICICVYISLSLYLSLSLSIYIYIYIYPNEDIAVNRYQLRPIFKLRIYNSGIRVKQILKERRWAFLAQLRPVRLLRVRVSEGLTQANS